MSGAGAMLLHAHNSISTENAELCVKRSQRTVVLMIEGRAVAFCDTMFVAREGIRIYSDAV